MEAIFRLFLQFISSSRKPLSLNRPPRGKGCHGPSVVVILITSLCCCMAADGLAFAAADGEADSGLYLKVQLDSALKISALKPGDVIVGTLSRDMYYRDRQVFQAGNQVRLTVASLGRRRRVRNDHWPWVIQFFTPRHESCPVFESASILAANGVDVPLHVSLISISNEREVLAQTKAEARNTKNESNRSVGKGSASNRPTVTLETRDWTSGELKAAFPENPSASSARLAEPVTLAAGTQAKIILLGGVSASQSRPGDSFQARLVEPVRVSSAVVLPEGSLFEGTVVKSTPPRMLSRAGSLLLTFTGVTLPGANEVPVVASVTGAVLERRSHTKIDPEGKLTGERPGKVWMLINAGVTAGIAKEVDDGTQLLIEALVSSATDVSTAGVSRIVAACTSAVFMITRHGRDVILPKSTEMDIVFDRPVSLPAPQWSGTR